MEWALQDEVNLLHFLAFIGINYGKFKTYQHSKVDQLRKQSIREKI